MDQATEAAALAAIKAALKRPMALSPEQEAEFLRFRGRACIRRIASVRLIRRGRLVWRLAGKAGADLFCHPIEWENRQTLLRYQREIGRVLKRPPNSALGVRARQTTARARAQRVLNVYPHYLHRKRNAGALIAKQLREPIHYVQRILRENVHDRRK